MGKNCGLITTTRRRGDRSTSSGKQDPAEVAAAGTAVAVAVQRRSESNGSSLSSSLATRGYIHDYSELDSTIHEPLIGILDMYLNF